jgi:hypothetical protein
MAAHCVRRSVACESRARGLQFPLHVCFAVPVELEVRGFTEDEELSSVDVSVRRGVAEVLDVGVQFVDKVISSHLPRHVIPFGPSTPMAQIRGAGLRTLTDTDLALIDELFWLNSCNGVGLSLDDISVALRRERGVDVSVATLSRTFAQAALTKKRAQPRHYYKYTPENIEYYRKYVQHILTTYVETRSAHRLRYLDESSSSHTRRGPTSTGARRASRFTLRTTWRDLLGARHHRDLSVS